MGQNMKVNNMFIDFYLLMIGEWVNDKAQGKGKFYHNNSAFYDGLILIIYLSYS